MEGKKKIQIDIEELHECLLNLAVAFHDLCVRNNIPYYMLGGTQLGAVRHKGFIPWDDDMDFGVPRKYYSLVKEKLKSIPGTELWDMSSKYIAVDVLKLSLVDTYVESLFDENSMGVNIDIFPLDYANGKVGVFSKNFHFFLMKKYNEYAYSTSFNYTGIAKICRAILKRFHPIPKTYFPRLIEKESFKNADNFDAYYNVYGAWHLKELVPVECFGQPRLYQFENTQLYGVEDYDRYLSRMYGDYMKLPPEDKRHLHVSNVYRIVNE